MIKSLACFLAFKHYSKVFSYCTIESVTRGRGHLLFHSAHGVKPDFSDSVDESSQGLVSMFSSLIGEPEEPRHQTPQL